MTSGRQSKIEDVLFIGPDRVDFDEIKRCLSRDKTFAMGAHWEKSPESALLNLKNPNKKRFDLIILDLPDRRALRTFAAVRAVASHVPVVVIARPEDELTGKTALAAGARAYLLKGHLGFRPLSQTLRSLIDQRSMSEALFAEKERAEVTLNSIGDAVISTDVAGRVTYLNLVAEKMTGWRHEDAVGRMAVEVFHVVDGDTRQAIRDPVELAIRHDEPMGLTANCVLIRRDGFEFAIEDSVAPSTTAAGAWQERWWCSTT